MPVADTSVVVRYLTNGTPPRLPATADSSAPQDVLALLERAAGRPPPRRNTSAAAKPPPVPKSPIVLPSASRPVGAEEISE